MKNTLIKGAWNTPIPHFFVAFLLTFTFISANAAESDSESETEKLAKETQNPIANLISVPFQNNFNFGIGPNDATQWLLNIQPVLPISLNKDWNLITRTIVPIINQPSPASGIGSAFGLGDINPTLFLSPANSGKLIWGVGPTMTFPTATESRDHLLFHEYFHGDNGAGLGASHQTGWTGSVAKLIQLYGYLDPKKMLEAGRAAAFLRQVRPKFGRIQNDSGIGNLVPRNG
jgi:hypothetical protein